MTPGEPEGWLVASHEAVVHQLEARLSRFRFVVVVWKLLETMFPSLQLLRVRFLLKGALKRAVRPEEGTAPSYLFLRPQLLSVQVSVRLSSLLHPDGRS